MKTIEIDKKTSYINFRIGKENFAVSVYRVLEIIQLDQLTNIPNASDFILGVLNFRGSIVPVIDMHKRFELKQSEGAKIVIIIDVENDDNNLLMGLQVDEVTDVIEFDYKSIKAIPDVGIQYNAEFLEGIIEINQEFVFILNIDKVLDMSELAELKAVVEE